MLAAPQSAGTLRRGRARLLPGRGRSGLLCLGGGLGAAALTTAVKGSVGDRSHRLPLGSGGRWWFAGKLVQHACWPAQSSRLQARASPHLARYIPPAVGCRGGGVCDRDAHRRTMPRKARKACETLASQRSLRTPRARWPARHAHTTAKPHIQKRGAPYEVWSGAGADLGGCARGDEVAGNGSPRAAAVLGEAQQEEAMLRFTPGTVVPHVRRAGVPAAVAHGAATLLAPHCPGTLGVPPAPTVALPCRFGTFTAIHRRIRDLTAAWRARAASGGWSEDQRTGRLAGAGAGDHVRLVQRRHAAAMSLTQRAALAGDAL